MEVKQTDRQAHLRNLTHQDYTLYTHMRQRTEEFQAAVIRRLHLLHYHLLLGLAYRAYCGYCSQLMAMLLAALSYSDQSNHK